MVRVSTPPVPAPTEPQLLALVRHAKAEHGEDRADHDRRLTDRGHRTAREAGAWLAATMPAPERAWVSSAVRAAQTWDGLAEHVRAGQVRRDRALYLASARDVVDEVTRADVRTMVVVGHNPTMEQALAALTGQLRGMRPGAVALVDLGQRRLVELWDPPRDAAR